MIDDESLSYVRAKEGGEPEIKLNWLHPARPGFLSIIIPVYNDAAGLRDTLESLADSLTKGGEWEMIVANDGGDPALRALAEGYGAKVVDVVPNRGSYSARNAGLETSSGEFIAFLDADERVSGAWYSALREKTGAYDVFGGRIEMQLGVQPSLAELFQAVSFFQRKVVESKGLITTANLVVRRTVFERIGGFDRRLRSGGDYEFSLRVKAAGIFAVGFAEEMKVTHPCRDFLQLVSSGKRVMYGYRNLSALYGPSVKPAVGRALSVSNLLLPRRHLFGDNEVSRSLSLWKKIQVWLLAWLLKLIMIPTALRIGLSRRSSSVHGQ